MVDFPYAFNYDGKRLFIRKSWYYEGEGIALKITDATGQPYTVLTINLPEARLQEDEFLVKTWSENALIIECIRKLDIFEETAKRVRTGFCVAEIWRLKQ